jgi:hypothetical protein
MLDTIVAVLLCASAVAAEEEDTAWMDLGAFIHPVPEKGAKGAEDKLDFRARFACPLGGWVGFLGRAQPSGRPIAVLYGVDAVTPLRPRDNVSSPETLFKMMVVHPEASGITFGGGGTASPQTIPEVKGGGAAVLP